MSIEFGNPWVLTLIVPLAAHVLWMGRRLGMLSTSRKIVAISLRLTILVLLVASLAGARFSRHSKELTVFFVLDDSESLPAAQREYSIQYLTKAIGDLDPSRDRAGIVVFGADAALERGPTPFDELETIQTVIDPSRTNIADALQLAMACFVGESQKRIVLLSDGNQNAGNAEDVARSIAAAQIVLDVVPLKYRNRNDVILEKTIVESRVNLDEPFDIRIIASAEKSATGRLSVFKGQQLIRQFDVELIGGQKNVFEVPTEVRDSGFHSFEVQLDVEGDLIPENNRGFAFTYGEGEPRVLLVDGDSDPSPVLAAMLISEKINVDRVDASGVPRTLRGLQAYDSIIFNNVGASEITSNQMRMIERGVHDLGIGFIMVGGENSFGAGGYNDSPIERILPVEMELKNEKIIPQGALVPIIHTSEIPQGQFWGEQVAMAALDVLSPRDMMGLLYYSWQGGEQWLFPLQEVAGKSRLRAMISGIAPGDMPSFDRTLQMAFNALSTSGASVRHVIVISDGDPQTPNPQLVKQIQAAKITISTVVISPHSPRDVSVMQNLAQLGGGNFYNVNSYNTLPQIFIKEATTVRKSLLIEEDFTPVPKAFSPLLAGFGGGYPGLKGYVATGDKGLADTPLVTHKGDPLLAHWHHGLGKTVAFTSDAKERWANDWIGWNQYSKFWAQLVRWSLRPAFNQNYQLEMTVDGTKGKVIVDAVDNAGEFRNFLEIEGQIISPSNRAQEVKLRQIAPGRYEAEFEVSEPGTYMLGARSRTEASEGQDLLTGGTTLSYSPEFQNSKSNEALLHRLADITGGRLLDETSNVFAHGLKSHAEPLSLWPALLSIILALFLADVFTRRVMIGWGEVSAGSAVAWNWVSARVVRRKMTTEGTTEKLLKFKETIQSESKTTAGSREDFLKSLKEVKITKSPLAAAAGEKRPPIIRAKKVSEAKEGKAEDETFTGQLLEARERARSRMKRKPSKDDPS